MAAWRSRRQRSLSLIYTTLPGAANAQAERPAEPGRSSLLLGSHSRSDSPSPSFLPVRARSSTRRTRPRPSVMQSRDLFTRAKDPVTSVMFTSAQPHFAPGITRPLLDYLVGARENRPRDRQAQHARGLEIDDQQVLRSLLDRQLGRFGPLEDPVDVDRGAPP